MFPWLVGRAPALVLVTKLIKIITMKLLTILTHPVLVICSFLLILISGQHFGGFYLLYLLMALPHGGFHAILALIGIGLLLLSYAKYNRENKFLIEPLLNVTGVVCLFFSLNIFFFRSNSYNDGSFHQAIPLLTLILFLVLSLGFLSYSIFRFAKFKPDIKKLSF